MERLNPELVDQFEEWVEQEENMLDVLWEHVCPSMAERERARKAVLLTLCSHADKSGMRGRIHTLLVGPPGTGKTELRNWVKYNHPRGVGIGPKSSEAGLKGDMSGSEPTPGALNMADGGILCIEELDKFSKSERDALYEAMSEGEYEVMQGDVRKVYQAEIRAVATANSTGPFKAAFKDRWDFVVECEEYDVDQTVTVTDTLMDNFMGAFLDGETAVDDDLVIPEYLKWIEPYEPGADDDDREKIQKMKNYLIQQEDMAGGIREKQSWLRIAYSIAKLNRRDMTANDFIRAAELLYPGRDLRRPLEAIRDDNLEALYS